MNMLVLGGGDSPESLISELSAKSVAEALELSGHTVFEYNPAEGYNGLDEFIGKVDMVFPILHGKNGEDGVVQKELESRRFNYLGSTPHSSQVAFDKVESHLILQSSGILMPSYQIMDSEKLLAESPELLGKSFVFKPITGGSSIDTIITRSATELDIEKAHSLAQRHEKMLYEELIDGTEVTVPILGEVALPVITIIPPTNEEFNYDNKYNGKTQELCPSPHELVSEKMQHIAQETALKVHKFLGARHLSRVDMIIDKNGKCYVLELNTMPGMTTQSLYPKSAKVHGLDMEQLVNQFIDLVKKEG